MKKPLNPATWQNVETHFNKVIALPRAQQTEYLLQLKSSDIDTYTILEELLEADQDTHPLLAQSAEMILDSWKDDRKLLGERIDKYLLAELLGQGAMGSVFKAERDDGEFHQTVALKILKIGLYSDSDVHLFRDERQILAGLQHPNIAHLYDGGITSDKRPYFTMEFIDGLPITDYCLEHKLSRHEVLELFIQVCEALQYAHGHLVAHLDLKPANILVDDQGNVRLLDFGISKVIAEYKHGNNDDDPDSVSSISQRFTLAYASPEQLSKKTPGVSSDIYTAGLLLFELLTGSHPLQKWFHEPLKLRQAILDESPVQHVALTNNQSSNSELKVLNKDLHAICLKACQKSSDNRYESIESLMRDILAFINHYPVSARKPSGLYTFSKFTKRNVRALSLLTATLVIIIAIIFYYTTQLKHQRDEARKSARKSAEITDLLTEVFRMADPFEANGDTVTAVQLLNKGIENLNASLEDQPEIKASLYLQISQAYSGLGQYEKSDSLSRIAWGIHRSLFGEHHPEIARAILSISSSEMILGEFDSAEFHINTCIDMYQNLNMEDSPEIIKAYEELANLNYEMGKYNRADSLYRYIYAFNSSRLQAPDPVLAHNLQLIGSVQRKLGALDSAEKYLTQALSMKRQFYEEPHNEIAYTLNHLSSLKQNMGKYDEALPFAEASFDQRKKIYGETHIETIASQANLARIYIRLERFDESIRLYKDAIEKIKVIFGNEHYYVAGLSQSLAGIYLRSGHLDQAAMLYEEAIELDRLLFNETDLKRAYALSGYGKTLMKQQKWKEAETNITAALTIRESNLPEGHIEIGLCQEALGECMLRKNDFTNANLLLEKALETMKVSPQKYSKNIQSILNLLAESHEKMGQLSKAAHYRDQLAL